MKAGALHNFIIACWEVDAVVIFFHLQTAVQVAVQLQKYADSIAPATHTETHTHTHTHTHAPTEEEWVGDLRQQGAWDCHG